MAMNDADFEMLARESGGAFDAWLRSQAMGHAIARAASDRVLKTPMPVEVLITVADKFYEYIKGNSDEPNLHGQKQDER
jgi:hypothetical protein